MCMVKISSLLKQKPEQMLKWVANEKSLFDENAYDQDENELLNTILLLRKLTVIKYCEAHPSKAAFKQTPMYHERNPPIVLIK